MMGLLEVPAKYSMIIPPVRRSLAITALIFLITSLVNINVDSLYYLIGVMIILLVEMFYLNSLYYGLGINEGSAAEKEA